MNNLSVSIDLDINDLHGLIGALQHEEGCQELADQLRSEHPQWTNARVFETAVAQAGHQGTFGRDPIDKGAKVVAVATDTSFTKGPNKRKDTRHPAIIEEMNKHWALEQQKKQQGEVAHADRLKAIHKLMTERNLSFDEAFVQTMQGEPLSDPGQKPAKATHEIKPDKYLMLVKGAHMGLSFNIHTGKRAAVNGQSE